MRDFRRNEEGYALVLTLLFMPVFIGLSLMIIDLGRGNNAHSDLYAAADALALAGAIELDGSTSAIPNAKAAMEKLTNQVSFLGLGDGESVVELNYETDGGGEFNVIFLDDIPPNDETLIDQAWVDDHGTNTSTEAKYVYVAAQAANLDTIFPIPVSFVRDSVPIQAKAVAGRNAAACKITPLFICNPFEGTDTDLQSAFADGKLHGRLIQLHPAGPDTAGPGNFGYLDLPNAAAPCGGACALKYYFSEYGADICFDTDGTVQLEQGAKTAVGNAFNTRFDVFGPGYSAGDSVPAENVRKGYIHVPTDDANDNEYCNWELDESYDATADDADGSAYLAATTYAGFPNNYTMRDPGTDVGGEGAGVLGARVGEGDWPIDTYLTRNHGATMASLAGAGNPIVSRFPSAVSPGSSLPSRYEVYRYEIEQGMIAGSTSTEDGNPLCTTTTPGAPAPETDPLKDRRLIQAAMINCRSEAAGGLNGNSTKNIPVEAYASIFLARPWDKANDGTIDVEIVDITGEGGLGSLENYIRVEAVLVR